MTGRLYIALLHYPVLDRDGRVITSAVTNADIHDIARSARTYGVRRFFIVTPIAEQAELVRKIIGHWTRGAGGALNPSRREALEAVEVAGTLEEIIELIDREESGPVITVATGARLGGLLHEPREVERVDGTRGRRIPFRFRNGVGTGRRCD